MNSLFLLTKKNLKLLLRAKGSALIVIFAPLIIILILGMSYNTTSKYGLNVGIYADSASSDTDDFITLLKEDGFSVTNYNTSKECIEDVKIGFLNTCIHLPKNLKIEGNTKKEINFHVDPSKINLVWMIQETVKDKFNLKSREISQEITKNILSKFADANKKVTAQNSLLTTVKDKDSEIITKLTDTEKGLSEVNTSVTTSSYNKTVMSDVSSSLKSALGKLDDALSSIDNSNLTSSEKNTINNQITIAKTQLTDSKNNFDGNDTGTISELVILLEKDLATATNKLTAITNAVTSSNAQVSSARKSLQESISSINTIKTELDNVIKSLESQEITDASTISSPLITNINKVGGEGSFLNYLFPALLVLVVMFSSLLLGTTLVMMEKNSPAMLRNFFLPISNAVFNSFDLT